MRTNVAFPSDYEASVLEEQPSGGVNYVFARSGGPSAGSDVFVEVAPREGEPWVGAVRRPPSTVKRALTAVVSTPHPSQLCVVVGGDAYLIDAPNPEDFEIVETGGPVVAAYPVPSDGLLLLASPWVVTAVGETGLVWQTERLAVERLRLDEVEDGLIAGVADPEDDEPRDFVIDLRSGRHEGGVPFS